MVLLLGTAFAVRRVRVTRGRLDTDPADWDARSRWDPYGVARVPQVPLGSIGVHPGDHRTVRIPRTRASVDRGMPRRQGR